MDRPREKAIRYGVESLTDCELLALLLRTGTKSVDVYNLANQMLQKFINLKGIANASIDELRKINGIGIVKSLEIKTIVEFSLRVKKSMYSKFENFSQLHDNVTGIFANSYQEKLLVIGLDKQNNILMERIIYVGDESSTHLSTKEIAKKLLGVHASKCIIIHNHPSQNSIPSTNDILATKRLEIGLNYLGIKLLEHMIYCNDNYYLIFKDKKYLKYE